MCGDRKWNCIKRPCAPVFTIRRNYQIVHYDSPDERGVDVALLYNPKYFTPKFSEPLNVMLYNPDSTIRKNAWCIVCIWNVCRRAIACVCESLAVTQGGEEASAPGRASAARVCKHKIDSITAINPDAKLLWWVIWMMIRWVRRLQ